MLKFRVCRGTGGWEKDDCHERTTQLGDRDNLASNHTIGWILNELTRSWDGKNLVDESHGIFAGFSSRDISKMA